MSLPFPLRFQLFLFCLFMLVYTWQDVILYYIETYVVLNNQINNNIYIKALMYFQWNIFFYEFLTLYCFWSVGINFFLELVDLLQLTNFFLQYITNIFLYETVHFDSVIIMINWVLFRLEIIKLFIVKSCCNFRK